MALGTRLESSRVQWKPCWPVSGWKGHGGDVAIGMAGSPVGVAGRPREDDPVLCVGILVRLGWGQLGGSVDERLPLAQVMILGFQDQVLHQTPCRESPSPSASASFSLSVSHE